jgi:hypothetical protein
VGQVQASGRDSQSKSWTKPGNSGQPRKNHLLGWYHEAEEPEELVTCEQEVDGLNTHRAGLAQIMGKVPASDRESPSKHWAKWDSFKRAWRCAYNTLSRSPINDHELTALCSRVTFINKRCVTTNDQPCGTHRLAVAPTSEEAASHIASVCSTWGDNSVSSCGS